MDDIPSTTRSCLLCNGEPIAPWPPSGKGPTHHTCHPGEELETILMAKATEVKDALNTAEHKLNRLRSEFHTKEHDLLMERNALHEKWNAIQQRAQLQKLLKVLRSGALHYKSEDADWLLLNWVFSTFLPRSVSVLKEHQARLAEFIKHIKEPL